MVESKVDFLHKSASQFSHSLFEVYLGPVIHMDGKPEAQDTHMVLNKLEKVYQYLDGGKISSGCNSIKDALQDVVILAAIYGMASPPEKLLLIDWITLFSF
ncbi:hypothetical protein DSO57_1010467 [Entomophthora muscae]|uniref:Uncharacterized protein n=1 Tax=Entomophthora muscae TaxID=34485 RepID=A0ACC2TUA3_9FUNG|nr:hypothetical protein DSO57_1010467 [Entomophthora muscae]